MCAPSNSIGPWTRSSNRVTPVGHAEPDGARLAGAIVRRDLVGRETGARAIVPPGPSGALGGLALSLQLLGRAVAVIRAAAVDQPLRRGAVAIDPLRLEIRTERSADERPFIPVEAKPSQPVEDAVDHVGRRSLGVRVFDPEHERAAVPAREQPVEERGARAADVQVSRRRRREADANHPAIVVAREISGPARPVELAAVAFGDLLEVEDVDGQVAELRAGGSRVDDDVAEARTPDERRRGVPGARDFCAR